MMTVLFSSTRHTEPATTLASMPSSSSRSSSSSSSSSSSVPVVVSPVLMLPGQMAAVAVVSAHSHGEQVGAAVWAVACVQSHDGHVDSAVVLVQSHDVDGVVMGGEEGVGKDGQVLQLKG